MPRESIVIQCGQCGNQIGHKFWDMALQEHAASNQNGAYDVGLSSLFRNVDTRYDLSIQAGSRNRPAQIKFLKARAILIDMEEGVVKQLLRGSLSDLFDSKQYITSNSGSGNNWAQGHCFYGPKYADGIMEKVNHEVEKCDSLQSFFLLHSLGGGTGSGTGTFTLQLLYDAYPKVFKFCTSVFPSTNDDVVTSPYNSILSVSKLCEFADSVFPVENQALMNLLKRRSAGEIISTSKLHSQKDSNFEHGLKGRVGPKYPDVKENPFDKMNAIVAHLLLHLTSSLRFEGQLNVDLGEIVTNMVPFPSLHFLPSSMSWQPYSSPADKIASPNSLKSMDQSFNEVLSSDSQLVEINPIKYTYLACALLIRADLQTQGNSDFSHNISRLGRRLKMQALLIDAETARDKVLKNAEPKRHGWQKAEIQTMEKLQLLGMIHWNQEGFKLGLCNQPPLNMSNSLLCLANNTSIGARFSQMKENFEMLYKKKFYLHHFEEYMDLDMLSQSAEKLEDIIGKYADLESMKPAPSVRRFKPLVHGP